LRLLGDEREGVPLRAIVNTHSNIDHIGGNALIQKRTGCEVWATRLEGLLTEWPPLEPTLLWSAHPFKQIRGKSAEAKPSRVTFFGAPETQEDPGGEYPIRDTLLTAAPLPGHYLDMIGVRTPDGVFFLADALFDPAILEKYHFSVMLDIASAHKTLDKIERSEARWFVPCHAPATRDVVELVRRNRESLGWITEAVYGALADRPLTREEILSRLGSAQGMEMDVLHLLLNLTSVCAHLTYLADLNRVEPFVEDCRLLWRQKSV
jgi:glyoxylase-like metal-dependent hydrolase (beta-lactamase superfamily II)